MSNEAIAALPPLRDVIREGGLQATKALGQNFLLDLNLTASIAKLNGSLDGLDAVEIGPGPGGLTRALLLSGARGVHAIEYDTRAIEALQPLVSAAGGRLTLHHADALEFDALACGEEGLRVVIANLPYNVATPILINLLRGIHARGDKATRFMLLMFQKEVAERIVATPDSKAYGRLAVMAQWLCDVKVAKVLPPSAFTPPPKVHSAVVRFLPKVRTDGVTFDVMEKLVAEAFGQRRKMLRSTLKAYVHLLAQAGIDETARAEDVPASAFVKLAQLVSGAAT
ncbi:MAG: 16S rRNA (adenine(1518)-N(6)/adenine(1519)-N(6))-dimethyltransferase RsmA [Alphaproteobacteria bacterium]|nr:16S rRNA (adenine(1518)-N(6)/adenine(1519)-N(6))-dimethyltransferase RsmA [Alphaproteobacteria bacterium]